ncbi:hypothetical protein [Pseudonocardia oroxyli]|uniref:hypothetical protein n=1 Tax=Pseudonocardia oroxyli TaxID=366584 RepID=UPI0015A42A17|nr:hypothetical protein [Pseudonocardia oroxyli]
MHTWLGDGFLQSLWVLSLSQIRCTSSSSGTSLSNEIEKLVTEHPGPWLASITRIGASIFDDRGAA